MKRNKIFLRIYHPNSGRSSRDIRNLRALEKEGIESLKIEASLNKVVGAYIEFLSGESALSNKVKMVSYFLEETEELISDITITRLKYFSEEKGDEYKRKYLSVN